MVQGMGEYAPLFLRCGSAFCMFIYYDSNITNNPHAKITILIDGGTLITRLVAPATFTLHKSERATAALIVSFRQLIIGDYMILMRGGSIVVCINPALQKMTEAMLLHHFHGIPT